MLKSKPVTAYVLSAVIALLTAAALALSAGGSLRARLVWLGMLDYTLYNFAFYLFGAAFNAFFLVYTALFALSILALLFSLSRIDLQAAGRAFGAGASAAGPGAPVKWIAWCSAWTCR